MANKTALHQTQLKPGMPAPWFEGLDQNGNLVTPDTLNGKTILLYFYPKDDTPPCIKQACSLRDQYAGLQARNIEVVGVSADDLLTHAFFAGQHQLPFSLLADTGLDIIKAYDVWGAKNIAGRAFEGIVRTSFLIGTDRIIRQVILNPKTSNHGEEILAL